MRILLLTHRVPFPLNDGGAIGVDYFITGYLDEGVELSVISFNTSKHYVDTTTLPSYYSKLNYFETIDLDNHIRPLDAFFNLFTSKSYHAQRFYSEAFKEKLVLHLKKNQYDIIQFDNIYLGHYIDSVKQYSKAQLVCRIHNIEFKIWEKLCDNTHHVLKKQYLQLLTRRLKKFELIQLQRFDTLLTIAPEDVVELKQLGITTANYYMPFGISLPPSIPEQYNNTATCYHLGSMDWMPNREGVNWFLQYVWSIINQENSQVHCYIAGKKINEVELSTHKNVHIIPYVEDAEQFAADYNVLIVPLLSGDGIRIKIIEAMALGKKIVTTTIGLRGIPAIHAQQVYIADSPIDFAKAISLAIASDNTMNRKAQEFVAENFNKRTLFKKAIVYFTSLIK